MKTTFCLTIDLLLCVTLLMGFSDTKHIVMN